MTMKFPRRRGLALAFLVIAASVLPLSVTDGTVREDRAEARTINRGHVYLIRGIGNIFSLGMDALGDKLKARGVRETVSNHLSWRGDTQKIIAAYRKDKRLAPIIIVGHSLGGNAAILMAERLGEAGIPVRLLVIFDATAAIPVPANVREAINFYKPGGRGHVLRPGHGFKGRIVNDDLAKYPGLKHMNVDESADLHARVVARVMRVLG